MPDFGRWSANGGDPSLNDINRTDRFLDSLAFEQPVYATDPGEAELAHLMAGWRDEVRDAPLRAVVTPRDAVVALDSARNSRRRSRMTLAVVGSAAAAVLCLGGFVSVAGAGPGDSLYGLRTMFFGEQQAPRDDAVMLASQQLAEVQQLIDDGQWNAAQVKLETLTTTVATVNDVEQKQELVSQWQDLTVKVEAQDAAATIPPDVPPPVFPDVPVVVDPSSDTATATSSDGTTSTSSETTTASPLETSTPTSPAVDLAPPTSIPATGPLPTPTGPLPTPTGPLPTPTGPLPTPTGPLPTPTGPLPTPTGPLPTPTAALPKPTPTAALPKPTPAAVTPLPTPTVAPKPTPAAITPIPTPAAIAPLPTPAAVAPLPAPSVPVAQEPEQAPAAEETPAQQVPAPRSVVTTTVVIPEPDNGSG